ncbi:hypothetical protein [Sphingomonas sp.]|uniref:hypothetical protein n=1 Tax=Sphingomonas sp. TaxID=28214 RepID=UPI001B08911F|nr:hypothetical protein [Sphingomonas sp.]MBO9714613.1 hypothetical protein [Sphingomonas sp.]
MVTKRILMIAAASLWLAGCSAAASQEAKPPKAGATMGAGLSGKDVGAPGN